MDVDRKCCDPSANSNSKAADGVAASWWQSGARRRKRQCCTCPLRDYCTHRRARVGGTSQRQGDGVLLGGNEEAFSSRGSVQATSDCDAMVKAEGASSVDCDGHAAEAVPDLPIGTLGASLGPRGNGAPRRASNVRVYTHIKKSVHPLRPNHIDAFISETHSQLKQTSLYGNTTTTNSFHCIDQFRLCAHATTQQ